MGGRFGIGGSLLVGGLLGLLVVGVAVGYIVYSRAQTTPGAGSEDVVVILALPDEDAVILPRVIDRYTTANSVTRAEHIDPLAETEIPGTTYTELREAYPFSGATGLTEALASEGAAAPSYVLVTPDGWDALLGADELEVDIPEHMEVFDGVRLWTFEEGETELDAEAVTAMLKGADYLGSDAREALRIQLGEQLARRLSRSQLLPEDVQTDLTAEEYAAFVALLAKMP